VARPTMLTRVRHERIVEPLRDGVPFATARRASLSVEPIDRAASPGVQVGRKRAACSLGAGAEAAGRAAKVRLDGL
jgi:hypothetical protein